MSATAAPVMAHMVEPLYLAVTTVAMRMVSSTVMTAVEVKSTSRSTQPILLVVGCTKVTETVPGLCGRTHTPWYHTGIGPMLASSDIVQQYQMAAFTMFK